jgi:hypothetical protein
MDMTMSSISNGAKELNLKEQIHQIIYLIKHRSDYSNAAKLMLENDLSIETLRKRTLKLSQLEIAKLADSIYESKG